MMKANAMFRWLPVAASVVWIGLVPSCPVAADEPTTVATALNDAVRRELIVRERYAMNTRHHSEDPSVKIDYDIVYVRARHNTFIFPDVGAPTLVEPGADLMLLHSDGSEELLVEGGKQGSVADPFVSFDGEWRQAGLVACAGEIELHEVGQNFFVGHGGVPAVGAEDGFVEAAVG